MGICGTILALILCVTLADQVASTIFKPMVGRFRPTQDPFIMYAVDVVNGYRGGKYGFFFKPCGQYHGHSYLLITDGSQPHLDYLAVFMGVTQLLDTRISRCTLCRRPNSRNHLGTHCWQHHLQTLETLLSRSRNTSAKECATSQLYQRRFQYRQYTPAHLWHCSHLCSNCMYCHVPTIRSIVQT